METEDSRGCCYCGDREQNTDEHPNGHHVSTIAATRADGNRRLLGVVQ